MGPILGAGTLHFGSEFSRILNSVEDIKVDIRAEENILLYH